MILTCKNYDFKFMMDFLSHWFGGKTRLSEIPREEIAGVINMFFGG